MRVFVIDSDKMREAFEDYMKNVRHVRPTLLSWAAGEYEWEQIQTEWIMWQNAWLGGQRSAQEYVAPHAVRA